MIGISAIGTPHGVQSISSGLAKSLPIDSLCDLPSSLIGVEPDTDVVRVRREVGPGLGRVYYCYYRFAKEKDSSRTGGFYGSVVVLDSAFGSNVLLMQSLYDIADIVRQSCLDSDSRFQKDIKSLKFSLPESVRELQESLNSHATPSVPARGDVFVPVSPGAEFSSYSEFLDQSNFDQVLLEFQDCFASSHAQVADIVRQKRGLPFLKYSAVQEELNKARSARLEKEREERRKKDEAAKQRLEEERQEQLRKQLQEEKAADEKRRKEEQQSQFNSVRPKDVSVGGNADLLKAIDSLKGRVSELENKVFPERRWSKAENVYISHSKFPSVARFLQRMSMWQLAIIFFLLLIGTAGAYALWRYMQPDLTESGSSGDNVRYLETKPRNVPTPIPTPGFVSNDANVQLNYIGPVGDMTIQELAEKLLVSCQEACAGITRKFVVQGILKMNPSISKKLNASGADSDPLRSEVLAFALKDIKGPIAVEMPACCDLSKTKPQEFKINPGSASR